MAYDKVVDSSVLDAGLKQIADAIREKGGTSDNLAFPQAMAEAIAAIEAGGGLKYETALATNLSLFDIVRFGKYDGKELFWFVSDTGYEGHIILTLLQNGLMQEMSFNGQGNGVDYDSSRYRTSAIRQFLNSENVNWYLEQIEGISAPSYVEKPGFLSGFTDYELSMIIPFECRCVEYSSTTNYEIVSVTDKVWIPSVKQCGGTAGTAEGSRAFDACVLSCNKGVLIIDGSSVFEYSRTQDHNGYLKLANDSKFTYGVKSHVYPFSLSIDCNTNLKKLSITDENVFVWWEVA